MVGSSSRFTSAAVAPRPHRVGVAVVATVAIVLAACAGDDICWFYLTLRSPNGELAHIENLRCSFVEFDERYPSIRHCGFSGCYDRPRHPKGCAVVAIITPYYPDDDFDHLRIRLTGKVNEQPFEHTFDASYDDVHCKSDGLPRQMTITVAVD